MSKVRLLIITDEMEVGGTQRQISHLLKNINRDVFECDLVYFRNDSFLVTELEDAGINVTKIDKKNKIDPGFTLRLLSKITNGSYDIVHCFALSAEIWGTLCCAFSARSKLVTSIRGQYEWYSSFQWFIKKLICKRSDLIISNSHITGKYTARRLNMPLNNLTIIHNGIDVLLNGNSPPEDITDIVTDYDIVTMFVGRLVEHKNIPELLEAFSRIQCDETINICLIIIGGGELEYSLKALANKYNLENVYFIGERSDVQSLLTLADFVISTSLREGLSNTILESMLCGVPVIASRVGGTPEIITHNINGILYESGDIEELVSSIQELSKDSLKRSVLSEKARESILESFSISQMVNQYEQSYLSLIR
jgi:glycosyltransferase involved in cell wall biosynthesis